MVGAACTEDLVVAVALISVHVLDHLIIGEEIAFSFVEHGLLLTQSPQPCAIPLLSSGGALGRYALARARFTISPTVFLLIPTSRAIHR